jgi:hypothetical protein
VKKLKYRIHEVISTVTYFVLNEYKIKILRYKKKVKVGRINTELISAKYEWLGPEYACALGLLITSISDS